MKMSTKKMMTKMTRTMTTRTNVTDRILSLVLVVGMAAAAALAAGCDDTDPPWELDNDRIIAVRSTPPKVMPGERAKLDVLVTSEGRGPFVVSPLGAIAVPPDQTGQQPIPQELSRAVVIENNEWKVVGPSDAELVSLRGELGLAAGAAVPLRVGVRVDLGSGTLDAVKTVALGEMAQNPTLGAVTINGAPAKDGMVLPRDVDVLMSVEAGAEEQVFWLSSIGDLSDEEDAVATLNHDSKSDDHLTSGHIAVVVRDRAGGVTWGFWTASVDP